MVEYSPRMGWPYPAQDDDPWYDPFTDFIQAVDSSAYSALEDRSIIWSGGGTLSWVASTGTLTWTDTLNVYSPQGGRLLQVAAGSIADWAEGEVVYLSLVRQPLANRTVTLTKALQVPSDNDAMALGVRIGSSIFFRTGISLGDGDSADGLAPVPGTGGGTDPNAIHVNVASEISGIALKATPTTSDLLVLEDAADGNNKKRTTIGDLPAAAPALHASTHQSGGGDAIKLDDLAAPDDNTDLNATVSAHGLLQKLDGTTTNFLRGDGSWAAPGGGGTADGRGFAIVIGNSLAGDTSAICDYLDTGDCAQLKAGIEAAAGKPVYIRPGTYDWNNGAATSNQITVPTGPRVLGAGMDAVTIRLLDGATEAEAFVLQGGGSVLEEFEIAVPTPTALIDTLSSQGYIYNVGSTGTSGLSRIRVVFEDSGWSTLADQNYVAMRYVIYSGSNGDRFFVDRCEFVDVPNYASTPALEPARLQIAYCAGQLDTVEFRENFSIGGYAAYELFGDEVVFTDNIVASVAYEYILRLGGNGFSSGTERPARIVNNDLGLLYDPAEGAQNGILCLTNVGLVVAANTVYLEGGTHANTRAIDIGSSDKATIVANRFDVESGWQYAVDCGSSSTGTIVANHLGSATITGSTAGWSIGLNYPGGGITDSDAIHDNVAAEISAIAPKATPTTSDILLIEDAAAADAKKSITIGDLPAAAPALHASTHQSGGGDAIKLDDLAAPDDNTDLDATVSAHGLLPKLGGGTTNYLRADGTWAAPPGGTDADAIHDNVAGEIAAITEKTSPVDADLILIEDSEDSNNKKRVQISNLPGGTATTAGTTSYRELATNALDTQGVSVVENDVGEGVFDAGLHQSVLFRATLTASWASTGTLEVKLYDDGPTSAPGTPRLVATLSKTADGGYEVFEQALTIVSSGASTNEVLGEARVYRVTIEVDGTTGDTGYIGSAGFVATGPSEALAADQIQAIVMSLNA